MIRHGLRRTSAACISLLILMAAAPLGTARTLTWSGYDWQVKAGERLGPGPNDWSDSDQSVWVDDAGNLHLKVRQVDGQWHAAEVVNTAALGYGRYEFRLESDPGPYDPNLVVGLFVYEDDRQEIDIEFARWGQPHDTYAQYVLQPGGDPARLHRFDMRLHGTFSTHSFVWAPGAITFTSIHGHHSTPPPGASIAQWTYTGQGIPIASTERAIINLWLHQGLAPTNGLEHELVVDSFTFTPLDQLSTVPLSAGRPPPAAWYDRLLQWPWR